MKRTTRATPTHKRLAWAILGVLIAPCVLVAASAPVPPAAPKGTGRCHALLVGGMPGTDMHARRYRDWLTRFHAHLTKTAGVPAANVTVLSGDPNFKDSIVTGQATAAGIKKAMDDLAKKVLPEDQFILVLVGHGGTTEKSPTLVVPGDDLTIEELAGKLDGIAAGNQVVLNFAALGGDGLKLLKRAGRVNLTGASPMETSDPVYAEFFLRGLESRRADGEGAAKDGTITLLEAYNWAARETCYWILRQTAVENAWKLDGRESVAIFKKLYEGGKDQTGTRRLSPDSDASIPDPTPTTLPAGGKPDPALMGRRIILEHAILEDCGQEMGVSAWRDKYEPIRPDKEGDPGDLAGRTVLGEARLLPSGGK